MKSLPAKVLLSLYRIVPRTKVYHFATTIQISERFLDKLSNHTNFRKALKVQVFLKHPVDSKSEKLWQNLT